MPVSGSQDADDIQRGGEAHAPRSPRVVLRVSSPASLLAVIPVTLGFQPPEPSIVMLGLTGPRSQVGVAVRYDAGNPDDADRIARHAAEILKAQDIRTACAVGYGPAALVTPVADAVRAKFAESGITVTEFLRAQDGRYWSYICSDPRCCPPEGTTYDLPGHPITRQYASEVLVSREALAATLAPATGKTARTMREAARKARQRAATLATGTGQSRQSQERALRESGLLAVADAIGLYRSGGKFRSCADAAWLALALKDLRVRDDAWARMEPGHRGAHLRLWTDLTVLAQGDDATAPASLLAFCAWQSGDGALGNVALDRALSENPSYSMALLLREALDSGAPPSMARLPMTPEEVAVAYNQNEQALESEEATEETSEPAGDLTSATA